MKRSRKTFITQKGYGKATKMLYYPLDESEDINLEPLTIQRIMKQVQVELLTTLEYCGHFGKRTYEKGIHSLDYDLAKMLVRLKSARYIPPMKSVPAPKASRH